MRPSHSTIALLTALALAIPGAAFAEEEEKKKDDSSESSSSSSGGGSSAFRAKGALLDASPQDRHQMISFFGFIPWYDGFGLGVAARYSIPIMAQGFIPTLNDSFELEFGADFSWVSNYYFGYGYSYINLGAPIGEARWTFHLTSKWSVYGKVGVGWNFGFATTSGYNGYSLIRPYFNGGAGAIYNFSDSMVFRAEAGYHGVRVGLGINL
ncbi:MAG: hypothetical protein ACYC8T_37220 [Myxococcaceae bacterium]